MPGNDFEKQVQQKMDELQFAPSDAVWPAVEKEIAQHKKRRALFLWLPLLLLLMGSAAWLYNVVGKNKNTVTVAADPPVTAATNNDKPDTAISATTMLAPTKEPSVAATATAAHTPIKEPSLNEHSAINQQATTAAKPIAEDAGDGTNNNAPAISKSKLYKNNKLQKKNGMGMAVVNNRQHEKKGAVTIIKAAGGANVDYNETAYLKKGSKKNNGQVYPVKPVADETTAADITVQAPKTLKNTEGPLKKAFPANATAMTVTDSAVAVNTEDLVKTSLKDSVQHIDKADTAKAITKNKVLGKTKKNIEWGININAGASSVSNGAGGLSSGTLNFSAPSNNLSSTTGNNNPAGAGPASAVKPGFSYTAGVFIRKPLGKNFNILAALNYSYYSNQITTGRKIDSATGGLLYIADLSRSASGYTNRFHFIELPVTIEKQLGKTSRYSVNAGFSLSFLAGSHALVYDAQKANYTSDKSNINKMQLGLQAGVNYRLFPAKHPIEIGPQFNYGFSSIFKKELAGSKHLFFYGVNAKIYLHKNKQ